MGSVRETWGEGCYTEDSVRYVIEGSGKCISFIGLHKGKLRHLARAGSANMFIAL